MVEVTLNPKPLTLNQESFLQGDSRFVSSPCRPFEEVVLWLYRPRHSSKRPGSGFKVRVYGFGSQVSPRTVESLGFGISIVVRTNERLWVTGVEA